MINKMKRKFFSWIILLNLLIALTACNLPATTPAPTLDPDINTSDALVVNTYTDTYDGVCSPDDCSLRDAVAVANKNSSSEIILPSGLYRLDRDLRNDDSGFYGDLDIHSRVKITGFGIDITNIWGVNKDRVFHVGPEAHLELQNLTVLGGAADDSDWVIKKSYAECVGDWFTVLPVVNWFFDDLYTEDGPDFDCGLSGESEITNVYPGYKRLIYEKGGGAIANRGFLKLTNVSIVFSTGEEGGGIRNKYGTVEIEGGFICDNTAELGGAIYNYEGNVTITNVGICKNSASLFGSAIYTQGGTVDITNVTFDENHGDEKNETKFDKRVETLYNANSEINILNTTFYKNQSIAILNHKGAVSLRNTLLAENGGVNCIPDLISLGNNIEDGNTCGFTQSTDLTSADVNLEHNSSTYGGVYQLLPDSPAIDHGDNLICPSIDQVGESRPSGLGCDVGAYELQQTVESPLTIDPSNIQPTVEPAIVVSQADTSTPTRIPPIIVPPANEPPAVVVQPVTITPTNTSTPITDTPVPPDPQNASISGQVWNDANGNGSFQSGESPLAAQTVKLGIGSCNSSGLDSMDTNFGGGYSFKGLTAGTYCVSVERAEKCGDVSSATTPKQVTVVLTPSQTITVSFGFQKIIC